MSSNLKSKLKSLKHNWKITDEEYKDLIGKLEGHDARAFMRAYSQGYEEGYDIGYDDGYVKALQDER